MITYIGVLLVGLKDFFYIIGGPPIEKGKKEPLTAALKDYQIPTKYDNIIATGCCGIWWCDTVVIHRMT